METCPVYSFCCLKGIYGRCTYTNLPKVPSFVCFPDCYGIGGKYFKHYVFLDT